MIAATRCGQLLDDIQFASAYRQSILIHADSLVGNIGIDRGSLDIIPRALDESSLALPPLLAESLRKLALDTIAKRTHVDLRMDYRNMDKYPPLCGHIAHYSSAHGATNAAPLSG